VRLLPIDQAKVDKEMTAVLQEQDTASSTVLYMVLELSNKSWKLGFSDGTRSRQNTIDAGDFVALNEMIVRGKEKFRLPSECRIVSCYEAGRDGFWIHRALVDNAVELRSGVS
jgi:transposase